MRPDCATNPVEKSFEHSAVIYNDSNTHNTHNNNNNDTNTNNTNDNNTHNTNNTIIIIIIRILIRIIVIRIRICVDVDGVPRGGCTSVSPYKWVRCEIAARHTHDTGAIRAQIYSDGRVIPGSDGT